AVARDRVAELGKAERTAHTQAAEWKAREEALSMGLRRKDGAGALLAETEAIPGLLGSIAALLSVETGYEAVLAAALGRLAEAVAVSDGREAVTALRLLKDGDSGQASLMIAGHQNPPARKPLPPGVRAVADL